MLQLNSLVCFSLTALCFVFQSELFILPLICAVTLFVTQSPWPGPAWPANEEQRLAATRKLQLLGGEPQPALQRYVDLVAKVLEVHGRIVSLYIACCTTTRCSHCCMLCMTTSTILVCFATSRHQHPCKGSIHQL